MIPRCVRTGPLTLPIAQEAMEKFTVEKVRLATDLSPGTAR